MSALPPITFVWTDDEVMKPLARFDNLAKAKFCIGERYTLVEHQERSQASHNHYFAAISEAWQNLPEAIASDFPTAEHLRKWALIKAGWRDERTLVASSKAEAVRLAAFIKPIDDFAVVTVNGCVVSSYTAKSQSLKAMGRADFQKSKDDVLNVLADMLQVAPAALSRSRAA